jgi:4-hydroxybutyryl-CoA dehydratase/vinylacetyl-CoA-Delta-isomerase
MLMSAADYRESLRGYRPTVYVEGRQVESVADEPLLAPGVNGIGVTYDFALRESSQALMRAQAPGFDGAINRMLAIPRSSADLLNKLEAVRLVCQETGCAQRYLGGDALSAIFHGTHIIDAEEGTEYHARLNAYLEHVYAEDLTLGVAIPMPRATVRCALPGSRTPMPTCISSSGAPRASSSPAPRRSSPRRLMCMS